MTAQPATPSAYADMFAAAKRGLPGAGFPWMKSAREEAIERFAASGFPTAKVEAWKFTSLERLATIPFEAGSSLLGGGPSRADLAPYRLTRDCHLIVFVNGRFSAALSDLDRLPKGTRVVDLSAAGEDDLRALLSPAAIAMEPRARALSDLNTAFMAGGAVIHLARGAVLDPVQVLFVGSAGDKPSVFHVRNLICAEAGTSASVVETYVGLGKGTYWTNAVTQVAVAPNAALRHYKLQAEGRDAFHIAATSVRMERDSAYRMFAASMGAQLARNEIDVGLEAPGAEALLAGVTLADGDQHLDTTTRLNHSHPRGTSSQEFRNVVDDRGHAVFQGSVRVAPDAQKTDARQVNRSLLLSATAAADTKPELEILADDVKCSHGAAIGDLDQNALFYLRARGVGEAQARALLINAFVAELIEAIEGEAARAYIRHSVDTWLERKHV